MGGDLIDPSAPALAPTDRGATSGDGCYTTIGVFDRVAFAVTRHRRRLTDTLNHLGLEAADIPWDEIVELPERLGVARGRLRVTVTAGPGAPAEPATHPSVWVTLAEVDPDLVGRPVAVVSGIHPRSARRFDAGHKTIAGAGSTRSLLAWAARRRAADEYLFVDTDGAPSEGTTTNLIVVRNGRAETPPLDTGCLPGITRELLLESGLVTEGHVELTGADEVILTSSVRGAIPVHTVDSQPMPGTDGPLWQRLSAHLSHLLATNVDP